MKTLTESRVGDYREGMDQIRNDGGNNTIRSGSSSDSRMQQHQQNFGSRLNAPTHPPPPPPPPQQVHKCPRCDSTNTKFCYYNNYSLSQPRYFCKACRRYWTQGGTLRNVPFGGGCRKGSKRAKTSTAATVTSSAAVSSQPQPPAGTVAPPIICSSTSYYPSGGGGFLSSLAAIQTSSGQPQLDLGGGGSSVVNIGLLQGLGILPAPSSHSQLFRGLPPPHPSSSNNEWITQGFIRNHSSNDDNPSYNIAASADSTGFWNPNRTSSATNSATAGDGDTAGQGALFNPTQWLGLPGYRPPQ